MLQGQEKHKGVPPEIRQPSSAINFCFSVCWTPVQELAG